jgi:hypothetical protein
MKQVKGWRRSIARRLDAISADLAAASLIAQKGESWPSTDPRAESPGIEERREKDRPIDPMSGRNASA